MGRAGSTIDPKGDPILGAKSVVDPIVETAIERGFGALATVSSPGREPLFPVALLRGARMLGRPADPLPILETWASRTTRETGSARYPWAVSTRFCEPFPAWVPPERSWLPWRPRDVAALVSERDLRTGLAEALVGPLVLADVAELLATTRSAGGRAAGLAEGLLADNLQKLRRDAAGWAQELHASRDTWALAALARRPAALGLLYPFALAIADAYAFSTNHSGGLVRGSRFPFHEIPLVSASAQLAAGLVALGIHPKLTGRLVALIRDERHADGGWGDDGPSDVLTTLVAARLVGALDPAFDPLPTARYLVSRQRPDGWWTAYGPETAWLTVEILDWLSTAARPFAGRFTWPHLATVNRDRRTGLPFYAYFADIERLFTEVPTLARASVELAFIDLAGFGAFNNAHGMAAGDAALRAFAQALAHIPDTIAIRDGGDEFIVLAAPTSGGLAGRLAAFRRAWPAEFARAFPGAGQVAPRVLTAETCGGRLVEARDELGRLIAELKRRHPDVPPTGIQFDLSTG